MNKTLTTIFTCATLVGFCGAADANSMVRNSAEGHVHGSIIQNVEGNNASSEIYVGSVVSYSGDVSNINTVAFVNGNIVTNGSVKLNIGSYIKR